MQNIYLDNASTTPLTPDVKQYIIELLDQFYNPSSLYQGGVDSKNVIEQARLNVANFINGKSENVIFTSSGSAANSLIIKGLTSEDSFENDYKVFYSPTSHKSMLKASRSCDCSVPLKVDKHGKLDLEYLDNILNEKNELRPIVCVEASNSEIGTINDISVICEIVHSYKGLCIIDATSYIPTNKVNIHKIGCDYLTFSAHKLGALKGVGVLYINNKAHIKPLIYGSQERNIFGGTENILGIASLGKAVNDYDYSSISSYGRNYVYDYIVKNIPDSYLIGAPFEHRLPHNLYMCFKGIQGESLMILLDMNGIQVSTGSACNSGYPFPSSTLTAIGMDKDDINSCIRMSFSGDEDINELNYICSQLNKCVKQLRNFNK